MFNELVVAGELQESSKKTVTRLIAAQASLLAHYVIFILLHSISYCYCILFFFFEIRIH